MNNRKVLLLGICVLIIGICCAVLFAEKVSYEQRTSNIKIEKITETKKGLKYLVGKDPYIFNSENIQISITEKQEAQLEVGGTYMMKYTKVTEGDKGSYVLEKIGERKE